MTEYDYDFDNEATRRYIERINRVNQEWTIGPGECQRCEAYVPQLVRFVGSDEWLCDECFEAEEDQVA